MSKEKKLIDMTLSELVDESLKKGLVPIFEFIDKDTMVDKSVPEPKEDKPEFSCGELVEIDWFYYDNGCASKRIDATIRSIYHMNKEAFVHFYNPSSGEVQYQTLPFKMLYKKSKPKEELKESERVEVAVFNERYGGNGEKYHGYWYGVTKPIHAEKFPLIKQAIEQVLNGERNVAASEYEKLYSEYCNKAFEYDKLSKQVNKMMEDVWEAARKTKEEKYYTTYYHPTLYHYKSSLK